MPKYIDFSPIRRLMKQRGAEIIAEAAIDELIDFLEKETTDVVDVAVEIAKKNKRKRITISDIKAAMR